MKIVAQKTFVANVSRTNFVFVKLYTDEGIEGVGEATLEWKTKTVVAALEDLELGAVEAAMLDIKGKALGVPVFELIGGKFRDRVECYANHWFYGAVTPEQYAANAKKAVAMGYRALKWDPFDVADLEMDS